MRTIHESLSRLIVAFPQPMVDPRTLGLYAERLSTEDPRHVEKAVDHIIDTSNFFPRLAEILAVCSKERSRELAERRNQARIDEMNGWRREQEFGGELAMTFRSPTGCTTLHGETWTGSDLLDSKGNVSLENNIYFRARNAFMAARETGIGNVASK